MSMITNTENPSMSGLCSSNITGFMCNHCGHVASRSRIITHILKIHRKSSEVPFACEFCNFFANNFKTYLKHSKSPKHMKTLAKLNIKQSSPKNILRLTSRRDHVLKVESKPARENFDYTKVVKQIPAYSLDDQHSKLNSSNPPLSMISETPSIPELVNILNDYGQKLLLNSTIKTPETLVNPIANNESDSSTSHPTNNDSSYKIMKLDKESQTDCSLFDLLYFSFNFGFSTGTQTDINFQEMKQANLE